MLFLILLMLVATGLGVAVVASVALPAHRDGRELLTPHGTDRLTAARARPSRIP